MMEALGILRESSAWMVGMTFPNPARTRLSIPLATPDHHPSSLMVLNMSSVIEHPLNKEKNTPKVG